jgi:hypothetical protein
MAIVATNATVNPSNGIGPTTYICTVATATVSVADACAEIQAEGGTIAGVSGLTDGSYVLVQGGEAPSVSGVTVQATI